MTKARRPRVRAGILLGLVGALGFVGGVLVDRVFLHGPTDGSGGQWPGTAALIVTSGDDTAPPGRRRLIRLGLPDQLAEDLGLTPAQRQEIERIVAEDQELLRATLEQFEPSMAEIVRDSREKILEVLTDEQAARWIESPVLRLRGGARDSVRD